MTNAPVERPFLGDLSPAETLAAAEDKDPNTKQGAGLRGQFLQRGIGVVKRREGRGW